MKQSLAVQAVEQEKLVMALVGAQEYRVVQVLKQGRAVQVAQECRAVQVAQVVPLE